MSQKNSNSQTHGHCIDGKLSPTYICWQNMMQRCYNKKCINYRLYGGRGIKIEKRFHKFKNFLDYMGEKPDGMTLDRKDTNDNYKTENMRWATREQQNRNRRSHRHSSSRYKGVLWYRNTWIARIYINGKTKHLGSFGSEIKAAEAYNQAALRNWGEDCYLNEIR